MSNLSGVGVSRPAPPPYNHQKTFRRTGASKVRQIDLVGKLQQLKVSRLSAVERVELLRGLKALNGRAKVINQIYSQLPYRMLQGVLLAGNIPSPHAYLSFLERNHEDNEVKGKQAEALQHAIEASRQYKNDINFALALNSSPEEIEKLVREGAAVTEESFILAFNQTHPKEVIKILLSRQVLLTTRAYEAFFNSRYSASEKEEFTKLLPFSEWQPTDSSLLGAFILKKKEWAAFLFDHGAPLSPCLFTEARKYAFHDLLARFQERAEAIVATGRMEAKERMEMAVAGCSDQTVENLLATGCSVSKEAVEHGFDNGRSEQLMKQIILRCGHLLDSIELKSTFSTIRTCEFLEFLDQWDIFVCNDDIAAAIEEGVPTPLIRYVVEEIVYESLSGDKFDYKSIQADVLAIRTKRWDVLSLMLDQELLIDLDEYEKHLGSIPRELVLKMLEGGHTVNGDPVHFSLKYHFPTTTTAKLIQKGEVVSSKTIDSYGSDWILPERVHDKKLAMGLLRALIEQKVRNDLISTQKLDFDLILSALDIGVSLDVRYEILRRMRTVSKEVIISALKHYNRLETPNIEEANFIREIHRFRSIQLSDVLEEIRVTLPLLQLYHELGHPISYSKVIPILKLQNYPAEIIHYCLSIQEDL